MCARYVESVANIVADIGRKPKPVNGERYSIDRMNNDGHYSCGQCPECLRNGWPMNIQWATDEEQQTHTRRSRFLTFNGRTMTLAQWSRETGIKRETIRDRIDRHGWTVKDALTTPVGQRRSHRVKVEDSSCPESP